ETCDPPDSTINPTTGQVRCRPDCTSCGDGLLQTGDGEKCDDGNTVSGCNPAHPQESLDGCLNSCTQPDCKDPAKIVLASYIDRFDTHGRLISDEAIDFSSQALVLELRGAHGRVLYRRSLEAGSLAGDPFFGNFKFSDRTAKISGGIAKLKVKKGHGYYI